MIIIQIMNNRDYNLRFLENRPGQVLKYFPVIGVTGARQSAKSTLVLNIGGQRL
jgi:hypothetical protein